MKKGLYVLLGIMVPVVGLCIAIPVSISLALKNRSPKKVTPITKAEFTLTGNYKISNYIDYYDAREYSDILFLECNIYNTGNQKINYFKLNNLTVKVNNYIVAYDDISRFSDRINLDTSTINKINFVFDTDHYDQSYFDSPEGKKTDMTFTIDVEYNTIPYGRGVNFYYDKSVNYHFEYDEESNKNLYIPVKFTNDTGAFIKTITMHHMKVFEAISDGPYNLIAEATVFEHPWENVNSQPGQVMDNLQFAFKEGSYDPSFWNGSVSNKNIIIAVWCEVAYQQ